MTSSDSPSSFRFARPDWAVLAGLLCAVTLIWCGAYNRWSEKSWSVPVNYRGDSLSGMAFAKAIASGEMFPFLDKRPPSLGAPFDAGWSEFPSPDEGVFAWWGLLIRLFGLGIGSNLALLSAHLLAAATFYLVCRIFAYARVLSAAGAILFALSHYSFARGLPHLALTLYWHIPLGVAVVWWCVVGEARANRKMWVSLAVAVLHGVQNPYYTGMFIQFLGLAAAYHLFRGWHWSKARLPLLTLLVTFLTFLAANGDTLYSRITEGPNPSSLTRVYSDLQLYALRPIELLLPATHRLPSLGAWTQRAYFSRIIYGGEANSPYMGVVGIIGLGAIIFGALVGLTRSDLRKIPFHFWMGLWVFSFSMVGGFNGILGLFDIIFFRGTNRYSIVILSLSLLFLVKVLTQLTANWNRWTVAVAAAITVLAGLWDQTPSTPTKTQITAAHRRFQSDRKLIARLEEKLPPQAMIFQLPVIDFPEVPEVEQMGLYEHLRPYLHSRSLRFSHGAIKGRPREDWQRELGIMNINQRLHFLEKYGFAAILLHRRGYKDGGAAILAELREQGRDTILAQSADFVSVALRPAPKPALPPEFRAGWHALESDGENLGRWSSGDAMVVYLNREMPKSVQVSFDLLTLQERNVVILLNGQIIHRRHLLRPGARYQTSFTAKLQRGNNTLLFETDTPAAPPGNGDPRHIAFGVSNFTVEEQDH